MYKSKQTDVNKTIFAGTVKYIGSSFASTIGEYFLNPILGV